MLNKKSKGLYLDITPHSVYAASTSSLLHPFSIDSLHEFPREDLQALHNLVEEWIDVKSGRFLPCHASVYPKSRLIRRHTIESASKAREANYFSDVLSSQLRVDSRKNRATVITLQNGIPYDLEKPLNTQKDVLFCGAENRELDVLQDWIVESKAVPVSLQLGTLSVLTGLRRYLLWRNMEEPCIYLDIGQDQSHLFILSANQIEMSRPIPLGITSMYSVLQQQLGLKDEESAEKLIKSNTFDFKEIGDELLRKILRELQASVGFFEVQTGQTLKGLHVGPLAPAFDWISDSIATALNLEIIDFQYRPWLESMGLSLSDSAPLESIGGSWFSLLSLLIPNEETIHAVSK